MADSGVASWIEAVATATAVFLGMATFIGERVFERWRDQTLEREATLGRARLLHALVAGVAEDVGEYAEQFRSAGINNPGQFAAVAIGAAASLRNHAHIFSELDMEGITAIKLWRFLVRLRALFQESAEMFELQKSECFEALKKEQPTSPNFGTSAVGLCNAIQKIAGRLAAEIDREYPAPPAR